VYTRRGRGEAIVSTRRGRGKVIVYIGDEEEEDEEEEEEEEETLVPPSVSLPSCPPLASSRRFPSSSPSPSPQISRRSGPLVPPCEDENARSLPNKPQTPAGPQCE
jgi:hypothetical protein